MCPSILTLFNVQLLCYFISQVISSIVLFAYASYRMISCQKSAKSFFFLSFRRLEIFLVEKEIVMSRPLEFIQFEDQAVRIPVYTQLQNNVFLTLFSFRKRFYLKLRAVFIIFLSSLSLLQLHFVKNMYTYIFPGMDYHFRTKIIRN